MQLFRGFEHFMSIFHDSIERITDQASPSNMYGKSTKLEQPKHPRIAVLTGAGISVESGISTFRGENGLWKHNNIEDVANINAWKRNPQLVLEFYNYRRRQINETEPNGAHYALARLAEYFHVDIITQNVDDLHQRAGSKNVLHLHGMLNEVRPDNDLNDIGYQAIPWTGDLQLGDIDPNSGKQLRPHIVWFGEGVPNMAIAGILIGQCDYFLIIGTSLSVYPAADLINYTTATATTQIIDPDKSLMSRFLEIEISDTDELSNVNNETSKQTTAEQVSKIVDDLIDQYVKTDAIKCSNLPTNVCHR
ncbi:MAG: SIR2 family NAD-dependent protein deacylase [Bacteroidota bacterium]